MIDLIIYIKVANIKYFQTFRAFFCGKIECKKPILTGRLLEKRVANMAALRNLFLHHFPYGHHIPVVHQFNQVNTGGVAGQVNLVYFAGDGFGL